MEQLLNENHQLKDLAENYSREIRQLKQRSSQHQSEIETLLKFNEKLLNIIEKQLHGQKIKSSDIMSLQPISEKSQLESDVFQSQLTNNVFGSILAQKKSNNFPIHNHWKGQSGNQSDISGVHTSKQHFRQPMANMIRDQQLSIVVDGDREHEGQDRSQQITSLIAEFRKPLIYKNTKKNLTDLSTEIKSQISQFNEISQKSRQYYQSRLVKLGQIRSNFTELNSKSQVRGLVESLDAEQPIKEILKEYIEQI